MAEIREIRDAMRRKKRARTARKIITFILLAALLTVIIINRDKLSPEAIEQWLKTSITAEGAGDGFPVKLSPGNSISLLPLGSSVAVTNQTGVSIYSMRGRHLRSAEHAGKNIQAKSAGGNLLVYSSGGNELSVETYLKTAVSAKTENTIITGEISRSGRYVIATESDVYTSEMQVFDKSGNAVFKWSPSGGAVNAVGISQDGYRAAASTVFTQGGRIISGIYLFSTEKSEALFSCQIENELVLSLKISGNGLRVVTDSSIIDIDADGEVTASYQFGGRQLIKCVDCSIGTAAVFKDVNDPGKSVLSVVGEKCVLKSEAAVSAAVIDAAADSGSIFLLSVGSVTRYDAATAVKSGEAKIDSDPAKLCANSAGAFVTTAACELLRPEIK